MQFSRISTALVLLVLMTFVSAWQTVTVTTYAPTATPTAARQCDPAALWCCNEAQEAYGGIVGTLLSLLGIVVDPITALVGSDCSSISAFGWGAGGSCDAQPLCCQNNTFAPLVVIGCSPITTFF